MDGRAAAALAAAAAYRNKSFFQKKMFKIRGGGTHAAAVGHAARTYKGQRAEEPRAITKARNSAATPDARTNNKRVCYSST